MSAANAFALGILAVAVAGISAAALAPGCAGACSCGALSGSLERVARQALSGSSAVFSGEVVDIDGPVFPLISDTPETVTFQVSEVWKGPERATLEVQTAMLGASCGYPFEAGGNYLVYAEGDAEGGAGDGASVNLCSSTKSLPEAGADLEALGPGVAPPGDGPSGSFGLLSRIPFLDRAAWFMAAVAALSAAVVVLHKRSRSD